MYSWAVILDLAPVLVSLQSAPKRRRPLAEHSRVFGILTQPLPSSVVASKISQSSMSLFLGFLEGRGVFAFRIAYHHEFGKFRTERTLVRGIDEWESRHVDRFFELAESTPVNFVSEGRDDLPQGPDREPRSLHEKNRKFDLHDGIEDQTLCDRERKVKFWVRRFGHASSTF